MAAHNLKKKNKTKKPSTAYLTNWMVNVYVKYISAHPLREKWIRDVFVKSALKTLKKHKKRKKKEKRKSWTGIAGLSTA